MALRNNIAKLMARAQIEDDPDVLERIAARIQDALNDKVENLRGLKAERHPQSDVVASEHRREARKGPETDSPQKSARQPYRSREKTRPRVLARRQRPKGPADRKRQTTRNKHGEDQSAPVVVASGSASTVICTSSPCLRATF